MCKFSWHRAFFVFSLISAIYLVPLQPGIYAQFVCQPTGTPTVINGSLTTSDPTQNGRTVRDARPSSCSGKEGVLQNSTVIHAKPYSFVSPVSGCAMVDFDHTACGTTTNTTQIVAYSSYNPSSPASGFLGDMGFSSVGIGSFGFPVIAGQPFTLVVHEITPNAGCANFTFTLTYRTGCRVAGFDSGNDGKADRTVYRPSQGLWYTLNSGGTGGRIESFGLSNDVITPGDYTGDGITDVSIYRPGTNSWFVGQNHVNPAQNFTVQQWGIAGDVAVPADYDRDGKTDIAVFRPNGGGWYMLNSSNGTVSFEQWGTVGDVPVTGDFDGDLKSDFVIYRPSTNHWWIRQTNFAFGFTLLTSNGWGTAGDIPLAADFDGDGRSDITVFRPSNGTWYSLRTSTTGINVLGTPNIEQFGTNGDIPQPADYDGDGKADLAVFRPSTGDWWVKNSSDAAVVVTKWGLPGDRPASSLNRLISPTP